MGPSYHEPAADRLLIEITEYLYLVLVTDFCEDVGNWVPTITPELLTGDFGVNIGNYYTYFILYYLL